jgi:hypothetical protein
MFRHLKLKNQLAQLIHAPIFPISQWNNLRNGLNSISQSRRVLVLDGLTHFRDNQLSFPISHHSVQYLVGQTQKYYCGRTSVLGICLHPLVSSVHLCVHHLRIEAPFIILFTLLGRIHKGLVHASPDMVILRNILDDIFDEVEEMLDVFDCWV